MVFAYVYIYICMWGYVCISYVCGIFAWHFVYVYVEGLCCACVLLLVFCLTTVDPTIK